MTCVSRRHYDTRRAFRIGLQIWMAYYNSSVAIRQPHFQDPRNLIHSHFLCLLQE